MKVGNVFGSVSFLRSTPLVYSAITKTTFTQLFVTPSGAIGASAAGIAFIDPAGATRAISPSTDYVEMISSDGSAALLNDHNKAISALSVTTGALRAFKIDTIDSTDARGQIIVGRSRAGGLVIDDGKTQQTIATGARSGFTHASLSPDGPRVAAIRTTSSPHHSPPRCGDFSWDEAHELVVMQIVPTLTPIRTIPLTTTMGCAVE
jgi:hypothetical protein